MAEVKKDQSNAHEANFENECTSISHNVRMLQHTRMLLLLIRQNCSSMPVKGKLPAKLEITAIACHITSYSPLTGCTLTITIRNIKSYIFHS